MNEGTELPQERIIHNLELLNRQVEKQASLWHLLRNGIIHGIGFILGSTVVTAIVVSVTLRFFEDTILGDVINWIVAR